MAASKKRTSKTRSTRKKTTAGKKSAAKNKASKRKPSRMLIGTMIVLSWIVGIIILFSLGILGRFLNHTMQMLIGNVLYLLIPVIMVYGFEYIWRNGHINLPVRMYVGFGLFILCWTMAFALWITPQGDPWLAFNVLKTALGHFSQAGFGSTYGFVGAILAGLFSGMFSKPGAIVVTAGLTLISLALMFWNVMNMDKRKEDYQLNRQEHLEKRRQQKVQAQLEREALEESGELEKPKSALMSWLFKEETEDTEIETPEPAVSEGLQIFSNGKLADDPILDEYRDPDLMEQLKLPFDQPSTLPDTPSKKKNDRPVSRRSHKGKVDLDLSATGDFDIELDLPSSYRTVAEQPVAKSIDIAEMLGLNTPSEPKAAPGKVQPEKHEEPVVHEPTVSEISASAASDPIESVPIIQSTPAEIADEPENIPDVPIYGQNGEQKKPSTAVVGNVALEEPVSTSLTQPVKGGNRPHYAKQEEPADFHPYNPKTYKMPPLKLLEDPAGMQHSNTNVKNAKVQGARLIEILKEFNVDATLGEIHIGPSVTEFEVIPGQGVRVNTFVNLQSDIKMALAAKDIRVEAPIPGKSAVGIEVPNAEKTTVTMKELIRSVPKSLADKPLVFTLGKDLMGNNVYGRLDTMPHLLIAGATGSGKSVCVNSIICSILLRTKPDEVKLLLVDPKKVEFTPYNGVPHLLAPVITDANLANGALKVIVEMMDQRYSMFEELAVRNIASYNEYVRNHPKDGRPTLPRIVVIIDELADLMLAASKEVEQSIQRITQLARAAGIHLIVATQRPSVNVITGVIKANIPSRIAFMVSSRPDSRTILDQIGAEKLLGYGDMLFLDNGASSPVRLQGVFIQDHEVEAICDYVKKQASPQYEDAFIMLKEISSQGQEVGDMPEELDPLYPEVKNFVIVSRKASTSLIQRRFRLGYGRAARILDQLEANGVIGPSNGTRPREILVEGPDSQMEDY